LKIARVAIAACVFVVGASSVASAEIVFMTSGGTLSVKSHTASGDTVTLTLRSGGTVTCDKTLIERIVPDEVPHPEPINPATLQMPAPAQPAATRGAQLRDTIYTNLITTAADTYGVDPILIKALIQVESNYKPRA